VIIMVQPTHDRKSNHLAPCILSGRNRSEPFRNLLRHPLMRPCLVEVHQIGIEDALELPLLQDQHVVQTFLPYTPGEALADGIGAWRMIGSFENLDTTCPRQPSEAVLRDNYLCERIASRKNLTLRGEDASWKILLCRVFAKPLTHGIWVIDSRNILPSEPSALQA
jgi:hypothetical protein